MRVKGIESYSFPIIIEWIFLLTADIYLSLSPHVTPPVEFKQSDKFYHLLMYFLLSFIPFFSSKNIRVSVSLSLFSMAVGIFLECVQFFIPFREFSLLDILANELGILLGILGGERIHKIVLHGL